MRRTVPFFIAALVLAGGARTVASPADGCLQDGDRIVFVGDSITGLGSNNTKGFAHLIEQALRRTRPRNTMTFSCLGGSGQSVGSWLNLEKTSRQKDFNLDVPNVGVKTTLDRGADVLLIMLGMNDILAPYVTGEPEALDAWTDNYRKLIHALRQRVHPRVMALCTITPATEDFASPKNRVIAQLNERAAGLTRQQRCLVLPTHETMRALLGEGRRHRADFHVTYDFVHPNAAGHVAIAEAMLKGLGEQSAAHLLEQEYDADLRRTLGEGPSLACSAQPVDGPLNAVGQTFRLCYWWTTGAEHEQGFPRVSVVPPQGWEVTPPFRSGASGEFTVKGQPNRLENVLTVEATAGAATQRIRTVIPAPWLVGTGIINGSAWQGGRFDPARGRLPLDASFSQGSGLGQPAAGKEAKGLAWQRYFASVNYTGGPDPASVDFWQATFGRTFEAGYAARWIHSQRDRPVTLRLASTAFAGNIGLSVWLNGRPLYAGTITGEPGKKASVQGTLRRGENCLVLKCNHCTWLWQASVGVEGVAADDLGDVRVDAAPTVYGR
jgi:lysophospholipase L1-like esterase